MLSNCNNCLAEIRRLVYNWKVAKWKETIATYLWYITAVNEESNLMADGKFWKVYKLSIPRLTEIKETDSVFINWTEFSVRGVAYRHWWNLSLTTVILELWQ